MISVDSVITTGMLARMNLDVYLPVIVCESCHRAFTYGSVYREDGTNRLATQENVWARFCPFCGTKQSWDGQGNG